MYTLLASLVLGILALGSVASAQMTFAGITDTPGASSSHTWVVVLQISEIGSITEWHRFTGIEPRHEGDCNRILSATDPGGKPDTVLTGTTKAGTWTIKMNLTRADGITRIWGQDATGQFWIGSLVLQRIVKEEPRRNRRAPGRNIH